MVTTSRELSFDRAVDPRVPLPCSGGNRGPTSFPVDKLWPLIGRSSRISTRSSERQYVEHARSREESVNAGRLLATGMLYGQFHNELGASSWQA